MKLLAIDSATEACSTALWLDGEVISRFELAPRRHTELLLPQVDAVLAEAGLKLSQLDALAFGRGPGSFTGVRIATASVQGLAWAAGLTVVPVSTLAAIAQGMMDASDAQTVACAIDARMGEVYWAWYRRNPRGLAELSGKECVVPPAEVSLVQGSTPWHAAGTGWGAYAEVLVERLGSQPADIDAERLPRSREIVKLAVDAFSSGEAVTPEQALPVYLRNKVTHQKAV